MTSLEWTILIALTAIAAAAIGYGSARWQDRLDPLWSRLAGGCHLNRKMDDLIASSGFRIEAMENARLPGPRTHTFLYQGRAKPA